MRNKFKSNGPYQILGVQPEFRDLILQQFVFRGPKEFSSLWGVVSAKANNEIVFSVKGVFNQNTKKVRFIHRQWSTQGGGGFNPLTPGLVGGSGGPGPPTRPVISLKPPPPKIFSLRTPLSIGEGIKEMFGGCSQQLNKPDNLEVFKGIEMIQWFGGER